MKSFFNYTKSVLLKVTHSKNLINFKSFKINEDELKIHFVLFARTTFRMINYLSSKDFLDFFGLTTKMIYRNLHQTIKSITETKNWFNLQL